MSHLQQKFKIDYVTRFGERIWPELDAWKYCKNKQEQTNCSKFYKGHWVLMTKFDGSEPKEPAGAGDRKVDQLRLNYAAQGHSLDE